MTDIRDELDNEIFICRKCKYEFKYTEGTWLPTGKFTLVINPTNNMKPELETSHKFTCYNCT